MTDVGSAQDDAEPTAATISVAQVVQLLDGAFAPLAAGVGQGQFAFWLGSGISKGRLPDLTELIADVLDFVADRARAEGADGPHARALNEMLSFAGMSPEEQGAVDVALPARKWPCWPAIAPRLVREYSKVMDVPVVGFDEDYLLWDGMDVRARYGSPDLEPDGEHLCVALLASEGVIPVIVTANWDGLVEKALSRLLGDRASLKVCVRGEDVRGPEARTTVYKIHGCAVLATEEPERYRKSLIVRAAQIARWQAAAEHAIVRERVVDIATSKPTLMIGLSAQDGNIQNVFAVAENRMRWPWPPEPIAHVFAEDCLAASQRTVLRCVYSAAYSQHGTEIETSALLRAYGKPLLVALVLHVLGTKAACLAGQAVDHLGMDGRDLITTGVHEVRDRAAAVAADPLTFIENAVHTLQRALAAFNGHLLDEENLLGSYRPLSLTPTHQLVTEPDIASDGRAEIAAAVGLLGLGVVDQMWTLAVNEEPGCALLADNGTRTSRVYLVSSAIAAFRLAQHESVDLDSADAVVVIAGEVPGPFRRSPSAAPGRTGRAEARSVHIRDVIRGAADFDVLRTRFQEEALL